MRLLRLLLPADKIDAILQDSTKLSHGYAHQLGGAPEDFALLDLLPDPYPYFLFHPPRNELDSFIRQEYAPDYRDSLHRLVIRPPRNLGLRLRAFRLRHDLTLIQTAALLDLSKSELHRLERAERTPSAQTAYRILRLLTSPLPAPVGEGLVPSRAHSTDSAPLDSLRRLWLSGGLTTRDLAASLGISPPHLIRLLRADRRPSRALLDRLPG